MFSAAFRGICGHVHISRLIIWSAQNCPSLEKSSLSAQESNFKANRNFLWARAAALPKVLDYRAGHGLAQQWLYFRGCPDSGGV